MFLLSMYITDNFIILHCIIQECFTIYNHLQVTIFQYSMNLVRERTSKIFNYLPLYS